MTLNQPAVTTDIEEDSTVPVIGIGASAGGLEALRDMFAAAGTSPGMCFVVVQHLDPNHESMMAQLIDRHTELIVKQCEGGEKVEADTVYIIPPGHGLAIVDGHLTLTDFEQPRGLRRPIDDFFISLALDQTTNAACVILSGTGADGTTGLRAIKEHGGISVVQEPGTAKYDGMPLSAVGTGLVDFVAAPAEIVGRLQSFFNRHKVDKHDQAEVVADHVDELCRVLRTAVGHDFSGYKRSTLVRRVERRMHVLGIAKGRDYLDRTRTDRAECEALFRDLLINVTRFFRDEAIFRQVAEEAIKPLVSADADEDGIRVWIPGCSSGEEAYSYAMLFAEAAETLNRPLTVQIIATDIDEQMLQIARDGSYPNSAMADIPARLREKYTVPHKDHFTIASHIRDLIRFSNHSVVKDPPFSRIDLVSCRNLLIYFNDKLQQSVLPLLHYALKPGGFLVLGPSETVGRFDNLFPAVNAQARIFKRSNTSPSYPMELPGGRGEAAPRRADRDTSEVTRVIKEGGLAKSRLMERYVPASLVVDGEGLIVAAYGRLGRFFDFPVTPMDTASATSLARPGLRNTITPLLRQAKEAKRRVVSRDVKVQSDFGTVTAEVVCDPLADGTFLFVFQESAPFAMFTDGDTLAESDGDEHLEAIESELRLTRHRLRSAVEELETANEELKSSNEEMMSMNEELQSTNEELSTVNDELKTKVDQISVVNADLRNFLDSTDLAVIVLDRDLRVRSFTNAATTVFPLQAGDRGRSLSEVASRLASPDYLDDAQRVAETGESIQRRVLSQDGRRTFALKIRPYRLASNEIDGAMLVLTELTDLLSMERELEQGRERLDMAVRTAGIGVWEYSPLTGRAILDNFELANFGIYERDGAVDDLINYVFPADRRVVKEKLHDASLGRGDFEATFRIQSATAGLRWVRAFGRLIDDNGERRLIGVTIDVTPEHQLAETRDVMLREMNHRVKNLFALIAGMIRIASRRYEKVGDMAEDIGSRIAALGRAHSLSTSAQGEQSANIKDLILATLAPYEGHAQIHSSGPVLEVKASAISSFALIIHEWATNSVKYGVLGPEPGNLLVEWSVHDHRLSLEWTEQRVTAVPHIESSGFGTILMETSARQLAGELITTVDDNRLKHELSVPTSVIELDE
ncbi:chemotaxis protein CheB [Devosia sp. BK]|uniref:chemotaxis protein CheB n=1 Tax=Devosia sp. BK TaxID=2871706 RepID=UPI00293BFC4E|nr:chemotaxis protein CheB [Devosia sp. BK]